MYKETKKENLITEDLDLSSSDNESDSECVMTLIVNSILNNLLRIKTVIR